MASFVMHDAGGVKTVVRGPMRSVGVDNKPIGVDEIGRVFKI
jgi:hypothetical protein